MTDDAGLRPGTQTVATGLVLGESPRWHDGRLWLADWGAQEIRAYDRHGASETVIDLEQAGGFPYCFDWLPDGRMLLVAGRAGQLLRREPDGSLVTHSDLRAICEPPWNDIVVDGRGNAYVGATGFDFPRGSFAPGLIALVTAAGEARVVAEGVAFPNGLAVTPDNRTLVLAESYGGQLTAFDIGEDGLLSSKRTWADVGDGAPDGICLDVEAAVWYADVPNQRCVRVREGGEVLQIVEADRGCFACMLGGPDGRDLFVVASQWRGPSSIAEQQGTGLVLMTRAPAPGAGWP